MTPASPRRILQLAPWSVHGTGTGGMASIVRDLTGELQARGHKVDILTNDWRAPEPTRKDGEIRLRVPGPQARTSIRNLLAWPVHCERAARQLRNLCAREGVDIIHAHYAGPYLATLARARRLGGPPFLVTCHGGDIHGLGDLPGRQQQAVRHGMSAASHVAAVSDALAADVERAVGRAGISTVYNGFKAPWHDVLARSDIEAAIGRPLPTRYAVMVGNMRPCKGHATALDAWHLLGDQTDLPLVLVGEGPDYLRMQQRAQDLGLDARAIFCGYLDRPMALGVMAYSSVVVAPSSSEGLGMFALEAGALARPLVCSAIRPLTDILTHETSALTVPPDNPAALADAILRLETDPDLKDRLATNLRATIDREFSLERMASSYTRIYQDCLPPKVS